MQDTLIPTRFRVYQCSARAVQLANCQILQAPILKLQETRDAMLLQGAEVLYTTPEEFDKFQRAEIVKWTKVIRDAKLQAQ